MDWWRDAGPELEEEGVETEYDVAVGVVDEVDGEVLEPAWWGLLVESGVFGGCWRKAAKKPERKKGRWGDMVWYVIRGGWWRRWQ